MLISFLITWLGVLGILGFGVLASSFFLELLLGDDRAFLDIRHSHLLLLPPFVCLVACEALLRCSAALASSSLRVLDSECYSGSSTVCPLLLLVRSLIAAQALLTVVPVLGVVD